jgi:hypothetical protein
MTAYRFLAWARAGAAASLTHLDDLHQTGPVRGALNASITVGAGAALAVPVELHGPGDVLALDQRQIVRVYPLPGTADAETTNFPLVEFDRPDLPWLFTPLAGPPGEPLRPWLALVCVPSRFRPRREPGRPLPVLRAPTSELPDPSAVHLWAHAQVIAERDEDVAALLTPAADPRRSISRLLAPRRLKPFIAYVACVVPTFEIGRRAGLNDEPGGDLSPAWRPDEDAVLPVYFSWEFSTGEGGDFETLADRLRAWPLPDVVGRHPMTVRHPGQFTVFVESALRRPGDTSAPWPFDEVTRQWRDGLVSRLAPTPPGDDAPDPEVLPPLYGRFHALRARAESDEFGWFAALNLDPRWRVAAGMGTRAVQREQERLMASAWQQLADIRAANRFLDLGRFARLIGRSLHHRHIQPLTAEEVLEVSVPLQPRAPRGSLTLRGEVRDSGLPDGAATLSFYRVTSPRGRLSRQVAIAAHRAGIAVTGPPFRGTVSALAETSTGLAAPYRDPDGAVAFTVSPEQVVTPVRLPAVLGALAPAGQPPPTWAEAQAQAIWRADQRTVDSAVLDAGPAISERVLDATLQLDAVPEIELPTAFFDDTQLQPAGSIRFPSGHTLPTSEVLPLLVDLPLSQFVAPALRLSMARRLPLRALIGTTAGDVRSMVVDAHKRFVRPSDVPAVDPRPPLNLADVRQALVKLTDPAHALGAVVDARIQRPDGVSAPDTTSPVQWAPTFPDPMWRPLAELSNEWLLAGLEHVPPDTASLAVTNEPFVQAYLIGANHEFGRELRWREYPTDQRGTWFSVFWGPKSDLPPLHTWPADAGLGGQATGGRDRVVLLLRSALLRRYPGAVIYVAPLVDVSSRPDDDAARYPVFRGILDAETTFLGFDLPEADLLGSPWCFVIAEQPSEPRFGIDDSDPPPDALQTHVDAQETNSAVVARCFFQQPVRVILPAARLLSPPRSTRHTRRVLTDGNEDG